MSTKTMKILTFVATALLIVSLGATTVFGFAPNEIKGNASATSTAEIKSVGGRVLGIFQAVGTVLAVLIVAVLGIKYMMGSAEEKADYKKTMTPYIIGAICVFLAPNIAMMFYNLMK